MTATSATSATSETMTDARSPAESRGRIVDCSVVAVAALVLGGATLVVADVDASRPRAPLAPESITLAASPAPAPGLTPAPRPARRAAVVRRSRAS